MDTDQIADITLTDGSSVSATDHHLFWVTGNGEWIEAEHLQPGDILLTPDGVATVDNINIWNSNPTLVWELTVQTDHTFTVAAGNNDVLVHNQNQTCHTDGDGNVQVINDDGTEYRFNADGTTDYVDIDGHSYSNVRVDADGNVQTTPKGNNGRGHVIYETVGEGADRSPLLNANGDGTFTSDGGVDYGLDDTYGDRVDHVLQHQHGNEIPTKSTHGTFDEGIDPIQAIDEGFNNPNRASPSNRATETS